MKKLYFISLIILLLTSCNSVQDHVFVDSEEIEQNELDLLGKQIVRALQDRNQEQLYRYFDQELIRSRFSDYLDIDLDNTYDQSRASSFLDESLNYITFEYSDIRKYKYLGPVNGTGNRIAISVIHDDELSIYEFIVTNYNNSLKVYDIYYPQIGYKMSEASVVEFSYTNRLSYLGQSSMYELSSDYIYENYEDYINEFNELDSDDQEHPWIMGNYIQCLFATNESIKTIAHIRKLPDFDGLLKNRYYQWHQGDSLKSTTKRIVDRYGENSFTRSVSLINDYYNPDKNRDTLVLQMEKELLKENDDSNAYLYLAFIKIEQNKYKDAIKYLDILNKKFDISMSYINDQLVNFDDFLVSQEYRSWRKF